MCWQHHVCQVLSLCVCACVCNICTDVKLLHFMSLFGFAGGQCTTDRHCPTTTLSVRGDTEPDQLCVPASGFIFSWWAVANPRTTVPVFNKHLISDFCKSTFTWAMTTYTGYGDGYSDNLFGTILHVYSCLMFITTGFFGIILIDFLGSIWLSSRNTSYCSNIASWFLFSSYPEHRLLILINKNIGFFIDIDLHYWNIQ